MVTEELRNYIKQKISEGFSQQGIKSFLIESGWKSSDIDQAFFALGVSPVPSKSSFRYFRRRFFISFKAIFFILIIVVLLSLIGGGFYMYFNRLGFFAVAPYTEDNLLFGLLNSFPKIRSSYYSLSANMSVDQRDSDAEPFTTKISSKEEIRQKYENDSKRAKDISSILSKLESLKKIGKYPSSLKEVDFGKIATTSILDPKTKKQYDYSIVENGDNFNLSVTFETIGATSKIKEYYNFSEDTTIINDKIVTFTKDSNTYIYLSSIPPKPFIVEMAEYTSYIPVDAKASASISAQSDWSNKESSDWKLNIDSTGDFIDVTYKFNVDALKKKDIFYFKINNIPSFIFGFLGRAGIEKNQWIKVNPETSAVKSFSNSEKSYKEHRQNLTDFLRSIITIANNEKLIVFKNSPYQERIDGKNLYRYDLAINEDLIVFFYEKVLEEADKNGIDKYYFQSIIRDKGYIEYLKSQEFKEVLDYYQKNTALTLWVNSQGFPEIVSYTVRVVPPDTATSLKEKQVNIVFKLSISDINKPVNIEAPTEYKDIKNLGYFKKEEDAVIKGKMSTILSNSTVYFNDNNSYDKWCTNEKYYLSVKEAIDKEYEGDSKVVCTCNTTNCLLAQKWCVSVLLNSGSYYCVDYTGAKIESSNSDICSNGVCDR